MNVQKVYNVVCLLINSIGSKRFNLKVQNKHKTTAVTACDGARWRRRRETGKEKEVQEDGARTLVTCVRVVRAEEGENDGGVLSMRRPAREEAV